MKEFWNERFSHEAYVYGMEPNDFFKEALSKLPPGEILLPGEGEGRNAVYAASLGWDVTAFDFSEQARSKALSLARKSNVTIDYRTLSLSEFVPHKVYDAIGLVFVHMDSELRRLFHRKLVSALRPGGYILAELFHKDQLGNKSGGPQSLSLLVSEDEIRSDFSDLQLEHLETKQVLLDEGPFHQGWADVVRLIARKPDNG